MKPTYKVSKFQSQMSDYTQQNFVGEGGNGNQPRRGAWFLPPPLEPFYEPGRLTDSREQNGRAEIRSVG